MFIMLYALASIFLTALFIHKYPERMDTLGMVITSLVLSPIITLGVLIYIICESIVKECT